MSRIITFAGLWVLILFMFVDSANAAQALFRGRQTWWFGHANPFTNGKTIPPDNMSPEMLPYEPPAIAEVSDTLIAPAFTIPKSFIRSTEYSFMCGTSGFQCPISIAKSTGVYSFWNAKGSFRPNNPNAPTEVSTVRVRTVMDGYISSIMGWNIGSEMSETVLGGTRTIFVPTHPPTAHYTRITPTEGGCTNKNPALCPGTTQFNGNYVRSRGGSIAVWPGKHRFGGTMRFFYGANHIYHQSITGTGPVWSATFPGGDPATQPGTGEEFIFGGVTAPNVERGYRYRMTDTSHFDRLIVGQTPSGGDCTVTSAPPNATGMCAYYARSVQYMTTGVPYTTGMIQIWEPNGNTNTVQTATGYDNRTAAGLSGVISLVRPRLVHAYTIFPSSPIKPIIMSWSAARTRQITLRFLPEAKGIGEIAMGVMALIALGQLRKAVRRTHDRT